MVPGVNGVSPHLCAAVLASSTPALCIHVLTAFIPAPSGSCLRVLPPRCTLSGIPNMKNSPKTTDLRAPSLSTCTSGACMFALRCPRAAEHQRSWRDSAREGARKYTHTQRVNGTNGRGGINEPFKKQFQEKGEQSARNCKHNRNEIGLSYVFFPSPRDFNVDNSQKWQGLTYYSLIERATWDVIMLQQVFSCLAFLIWMNLTASKENKIIKQMKYKSG